MRLSPPARCIAVTGFMATGKTTVGRLIAEKLGLDFVDTDELVEANAGRTIPAIFEEDGEAHFRDLESAALRQALGRRGRVVSTGGGMLLRDENVAELRAAGPIVCLTAAPEEILERVAGDEGRPLLNVDDPAGRIARLLRDRAEAYARADYHVDTTGLTQEQVADRLIDALAGDPRARWLCGSRTRVPVQVEGGEYDILVGSGVIDKLGDAWPAPECGRRAAIVTTDTIGPLYAERVAAALRDGGWRPTVVEVPDGEASKSLEVFGEVCDAFADAGLDRGSTVFALGGGVVGDLAGFAAATYMRGIDLVHVPTSLLAQVDSSIGGKTAIDIGAGKNLVGAFHQPRAVFTDIDVLSTLPDAEIRSGLGEIIKHACCFDAEMFAFLSERPHVFAEDDRAAREYLVARNCQIKAEVVAADPLEQGVRAVLNYGHTVGHALERGAREWGLRHGEVVAAGIVAESRLAVELGVSDDETAARQERVIAAMGLPTSVSGVDVERAREALLRDKKIVNGRLRMPLVPEIGRYVIVERVDIETVADAMLTVLD